MTIGFSLLGGLGLFLIGMQVLTDGLRGLSGESLRRFLIRFTKDPFSGAATGAVSTAVIQSSSATTITAVGFVGAGLLTFHQALGVVFGANIGTTITGWAVALIGFKLDITLFVFPLAFIGALLKLFARGRLQQIGWALAGFSLVFIGIDALQTGMSAYQDLVTPKTFPGDTFFGRLQLVGIGILITVVTQSSSAGVATALVALSIGAISFNQAAAMVIGMDVGTTFSAAIAALGGSTAMRRTGYAHVIYNVLTGILALALLTPFSIIASNWLSLDGTGDAQIALVAFHTTFNTVGVLAVLGFTHQFAAIIERLVPGEADDLVAPLDQKLLRDGEAATDAATGCTEDLTVSLFELISASLSDQNGQRVGARPAFDQALSQLTDYTSKIQMADGTAVSLRIQSLVHAQDHLIRLKNRFDELPKIELLRATRGFDHAVQSFRTVLGESHERKTEVEFLEQLNSLRRTFRAEREQHRAQSFADVAQGKVSPESAIQRSDAMRWLHRSAYHVWRICLHLANVQAVEPKQLRLTEERRLEFEDSAD